MTRCILYARVSTERQAERQASIPAQLRIMKDYVKKKGWSIAKVYKEEGESARTTDRPVLKAALEHARKDGSIDVVLVHKMDRLTRSILDSLMIRADLKSAGVRLDSATEHIGEKPHEVMQQNIVAAVNEWYSANLAEEAKKGLNQAVLEGRWPHQPPMGYTMGKNEQGKSIPVPDKETAPFAKLMFQLYANDQYSLRELSREMARRGCFDSTGKPMLVDIVRKRLSNPFYIGKMRWRGKIYPGAHEPIVSASTFKQVQKIMARRSRRPGEDPRRHSFLLRGLALCRVCERLMTAERHRKGSYYRCLPTSRGGERICSQPYAREDVIDAEAVDFYRRISTTSKGLDALAAQLQERLKDREANAKRELKKLRKKIAASEEKLVNVSSLLVEGKLSERAYEPIRERTENAIMMMEGQVEELEGVKATADADMLPLAVQLAGRLDVVHKALGKRRRKDLARLVFRSIEVHDRHVVAAELQPPFSWLFDEVVLRPKSGNPWPATSSSLECPQDTSLNENKLLQAILSEPRVRKVMGC